MITLFVIMASVRLSIYFQYLSKQNTIQMRIVIAIGGTMSLAEGITDAKYDLV